MPSEPHGGASDPEKRLWSGSPSQVINLPKFVMSGVAAGALWWLSETFLTPEIIAALTPWSNQPGLSLLSYLPFIPIAYAFWSFLVVRNIRYDLSNQRLRIRFGVLNKKITEVELYRVKDHWVSLPIYLRVLGLGTVVLTTSDGTHPIVAICAVPEAERLRNVTRLAVEQRRVRRGVREIDVGGR